MGYFSKKFTFSEKLYFTCILLKNRLCIYIFFDFDNYYYFLAGTTMYMRTSPMHPQPHPCRGAASEAPPGAAASERPERPGLTRPSPSPIPMLPCTTASSTTVVTNTANSQEAIHLATVNENSPKSLASCQNLDLYSICSPKSLCGPHPRKVTIVVALVLSIWASFVLGINIHKRVR